MGEAPYPWPVKVWFCDYCDRAADVGQKPDECPRCHRDSMSAVEAAPAFHWDDLKAGLLDG